MSPCHIGCGDIFVAAVHPLRLSDGEKLLGRKEPSLGVGYGKDI